MGQGGARRGWLACLPRLADHPRAGRDRRPRVSGRVEGGPPPIHRGIRPRRPR